MSSPELDAVLYRYTNPSDQLATLATTELIQFNLATKPDGTGRTISDSFHMSRDINIHPNPRRALDQVQDSLLGLLDVTLNGYFISHASTLGPINLYNWQVEPATNVSFPFGRFGLQLNSLANGVLNLEPTEFTGYILWDVQVDDVEEPRDEVQFSAQLYRNGDISTVAFPP